MFEIIFLRKVEKLITNNLCLQNISNVYIYTYSLTYLKKTRIVTFFPSKYCEINFKNHLTRSNQ